MLTLYCHRHGHLHHHIVTIIVVVVVLSFVDITLLSFVVISMLCVAVMHSILSLEQGLSIKYSCVSYCIVSLSEKPLCK